MKVPAQKNNDRTFFRQGAKRVWRGKDHLPTLGSEEGSMPGKELGKRIGPSKVLNGRKNLNSRKKTP